MVSIYLSVHLESDLSCFPVAAHQYKAVAEIFLILYDPSPQGGHLDYRNLTSVEDQALQICGSAWTNLDEAARVNAFGPMAFCESSLCEIFQRAVADSTRRTISAQQGTSKRS
jgi:hypothetical protein